LHMLSLFQNPRGTTAPQKVSASYPAENRHVSVGLIRLDLLLPQIPKYVFALS